MCETVAHVIALMTPDMLHAPTHARNHIVRRPCMCMLPYMHTHCVLERMAVQVFRYRFLQASSRSPPQHVYMSMPAYNHGLQSLSLFGYKSLYEQTLAHLHQYVCMHVCILYYVILYYIVYIYIYCMHLRLDYTRAMRVYNALNSC